MSENRRFVPSDVNRLKERDCPYCKRFMDADFLREKLDKEKKEKSEKIKSSIGKRKEDGENVGRPKALTEEQEKIAMLFLQQGKSIYQTAQHMGVSHMTIDRIRKERNGKSD